MKNRTRRRGRSAGFTLVEALVVIAVMGIVMTLGLPAFLGMINRNQLLGTTRELAALMRSARIESVRRGLPTVVRPLATGDGYVAFVTQVRDAQGRFSNLDLDPPTEREIGRLALPRRVQINAPAADNLVNSFAGTAPSPPFAPDLAIPGAVFMPDGSALVAGAFRLSDGEGRNFFEVRLAPRFTGHVALRKFDPTPPVVGVNWYESGFSSEAATGSGRNTWEWL